MNQPLERHLQQSAIAFLKARGWCVRKRHGSVMGVAGDPDLYALYRGVHYEIELKAPGGRPTPLQQARLEEWRRAGAVTWVIDSMTVLRTLVAAIVE
jgi:hypothetical protein